LWLGGDYATLTFAIEDPANGRDMDAKIIEAIIANPQILRVMRRLFRGLRLELVGHKSWAFFEAGTADFLEAWLRPYPMLLPLAGVASAEKAEAFVAAQLKGSAEGTSLLDYNFHAFVQV
jgi:hypothetical protein